MLFPWSASTSRRGASASRSRGSAARRLKSRRRTLSAPRSRGARSSALFESSRIRSAAHGPNETSPPARPRPLSRRISRRARSAGATSGSAGNGLRDALSSASPGGSDSKSSETRGASKRFLEMSYRRRRGQVPIGARPRNALREISSDSSTWSVASRGQAPATPQLDRLSMIRRGGGAKSGPSSRFRRRSSRESSGVLASSPATYPRRPALARFSVEGKVPAASKSDVGKRSRADATSRRPRAATAARSAGGASP
mmetsp:Transcript_10366/g.31959  ORF Transcript_10366/g.31959 Transcript_10366/m.31959 type:complete len:256 (+) Transcript_10366:122-889(+)